MHLRSRLRCAYLCPLLPTSRRCLSMWASVRMAQIQVTGAFRFEQASETCLHSHDPCGFPSKLSMCLSHPASSLCVRRSILLHVVFGAHANAHKSV